MIAVVAATFSIPDLVVKIYSAPTAERGAIVLGFDFGDLFNGLVHIQNFLPFILAAVLANKMVQLFYFAVWAINEVYDTLEAYLRVVCKGMVAFCGT